MLPLRIAKQVDAMRAEQETRKATPTTPTAKALTSSDGVAEWEAALSTAEKMMKETETKEGSTYYYWQGRYDEAESALDRVRRHSATAKLIDRRGEARES